MAVAGQVDVRQAGRLRVVFVLFYMTQMSLMVSSTYKWLRVHL